MYPALGPGMIGVELCLDECARLAAQVGFKGISVDVGAAAADPAAVRSALEVNKLAAASWGLPVEFRQDEERHREGLARLPELAKAAKQIGADRCSTWILPFSEVLTFEENFELHRKRLRECAEVLGEHGCRLGLEFVGTKTLRDGKPHEFIHTQEGMLELCEAIGTGNVGLLVDCFHWYTSHGGIDDIRKLSDALVVDVHINDGAEGRGPDEQIDNDRRLPGESGVIDLTAFLQGLKAIGYTGPVTPEPFSPKLGKMPAEEAIRTTAEALLGVWKAADV
ncbi:MAG: sugar phosphate isomerase/epimerase [Armatimonadota bacterium]|nr:MAG: sugar phosphate isomerase/epimerase [Armatimonadota bacterium]